MAATSTKKSSSALARMPIEDYNRLSVKAIVPRLTELNDRELEALMIHEKSGKNRVTLLQAVRKLQLAREAGAARHVPAADIRAVDATLVDDIDAAHDLEMPKNLDAANDLDAAHDPEAVDELDEADLDEADLDEADLDEADLDMRDDLDGDWDGGWDDEEPIVVAAPVPEPVAKKKTKKSDVAPAAPKANARGKAKAKAPVPVEDKKPRPPVKAATWEEEVRPELPRRIAAAASAFELEYEPAPSMALVPPLSSESSSAPTTAAPRFAGLIRIQKKFEGAALVMAAILAILLGLAIGTVLARTGSVSAQPTPASVSTQSAPVAPGG